MKIDRMLTLTMILLLTGLGSACAQGAPAPGPGLTVTSTAFEDGGIIPSKYTQGVSDFVSPALQWTHVPANTVSFVLIMHDPDAALIFFQTKRPKADDILGRRSGAPGRGDGAIRIGFLQSDLGQNRDRIERTQPRADRPGPRKTNRTGIDLNDGGKLIIDLNLVRHPGSVPRILEGI